MLKEGEIPELHDGMRSLNGSGFPTNVLPSLGFSIPSQHSEPSKVDRRGLERRSAFVDNTSHAHRFRLGFDLEGKEQLNNLANTKKWIGTAGRKSTTFLFLC